MRLNASFLPGGGKNVPEVYLHTAGTAGGFGGVSIILALLMYIGVSSKYHLNKKCVRLEI